MNREWRSRNSDALAEEFFELHADMQTLSAITPVLAPLQELVFGKISLSGRPYMIAATLFQTIVSLNEIIEKRNEALSVFRKGEKKDLKALIEFYFGVVDEHGNRDETLSQLIDAISQLTDDCIAFSRLLSDDLHVFGERCKATHEKKYRGEVPNISKADWSEAEKNGLMPNMQFYSDWTTKFAPAKTVKARRRLWGNHSSKIERRKSTIAPQSPL